MPPPATFYTISSFPYSQVVTQADFNTGAHGGAANEVWFKFVASGSTAIGCYATQGGTFLFKVFAYESDALTLRDTVHRAAFWLKVTTVTNYWFKFIKNPSGGASDFDFTVHFDERPRNPSATPGDYIINDDEAGFGATIIAPDGTIRGFTDSVPGGEILCTLTSGHVLVHDRFQEYGGSSRLVLLDPSLALISSFDLSPSLSTVFPNFCDAGDLFFVCNNVNRNVYTIDTAATVTQVATAIAGVGGVNAIGVNADRTILYYVASGEIKIRRWDLTSDTALSDFYTVAESGALARSAVNSHPGEILVLSDNTVVTYNNVGGSITKLYHVNAAGTLLHSYTYSASSLAFDHISRSPSDPAFINVWLFQNGSDQSGRFAQFQLGTGTFSPTFDQELFSVGVNKNDDTAVMFGPSSSCGFGTLLLDDADSVVGTPEIPQANSSECCASPGVEGSGVVTPGAGVERPVLLSAAWTGRCEGGGSVALLADLTDDEDWSDS